MRKISRYATCLLTFLTLIPAIAFAQSYPTRPVHVIVPFPPGQATDILARLVTQSLAQKYNVGFPVDNRGGAGGIAGLESAANARPDGYTILVSASGPLVINPSIYLKLPYNPLTSYEPISLLGMLPLVLVVNPSVPAHTVEELIRLAKAQPGKLNFASSGAGTAQHLAGELFKWRTHIDITHIPYRGSAPAEADLISGRVQIMFDTVAAALPYIKAGQLRPLAVTVAKRTSALPGVPTMQEAGVADFEAAGWSAMLAPAGTPPDVIRQLSEQTAEILRSPGMQQRIIAMGMEPMSSTPEDLTIFLKRQMAQWKKAVEIAGIKPH